MQTTENEEKQLPIAPADPQSQQLANIPLMQKEDEDDPEIIFANAVAEIDTQPLILKKPKRTGTLTIGDMLEIMFDVSLLLFILVGSIYLCITYPHMLVILYEKTTPAHLTTTLDIQTRALAPVTITRFATLATTGQGHQTPTTATGQVTFYNGLSIEQTVPAGTKLTGSDGEQTITDQTATVPPNAPPEDGYVTVSAHALNIGAAGNIKAFDIVIALSSSLTVKNLLAFTGGRDARTFKAVSAKDLQNLTLMLNETVSQAFTTAFPLQRGEATIPTNCHTTNTPNHQIGEEAQALTLTTSKTCSAVAYNQSQLTKAATAAFTKTRPGATYHSVGSIQISLIKVTPLTIVLSGKWAYTFSQDYQDYLAEKIAGKTPAQAQKLLLHTGVISYASIPNNLPPVGMYINFLVLVS